MRDTRETLESWGRRPWQVLRAWLALSLAIALVLLAATWVAAGLLTPDLTPIHLPGLTSPSEPAARVKRISRPTCTSSTPPKPSERSAPCTALPCGSRIPRRGVTRTSTR